MKSLAAVLLLIVAVPVTGAEWVSFTAPRGSFRAVFPTQPQESVESIQTDLGAIPYTTYMSEIENGSVAFSVAFNDYPPSIQQADPNLVLDGGRDGAKENLKGTVVSEISLTYQGAPGREFTIISDLQGQKLFYHTRIFLIGTRLYQMQIVRLGETPIDIADAVRFFSSFEQVAP
ncbi:MAG: hypothetical protein ACK5Q5_16755 [Planctomycetaceae bacterium]